MGKALTRTKLGGVSVRNHAVLSSCPLSLGALVYGRVGLVPHGGRDRVSSECRVCVFFVCSPWSSRFVTRPRHFSCVLFLVATAPQPMLVTSRVRSYDRGPLEAECAASPKVPGLPIMGVMRSWRTTLTGNDAFQLRDTHVKLRHFTCDVAR